MRGFILLVGAAMVGAFTSVAEADTAQMSSSTDALHAACGRLGYLPGEAQFNDCLSILKDASMAAATPTSMRMRKTNCMAACLAAGLAPDSPGLTKCVERLRTTLDGETGTPG